MKCFINYVNISDVTADNMNKLLDAIKGEEYAYYVEALNKSIKLLIAGYVGILKLYKRVEPRPFLFFVDHFNVPVITSQKGEKSAANIAFTKFFEMLDPHLALTKDKAALIVKYHRQTNISSVNWASLSEYQRNLLRKLFLYKGNDWFGYTVNETSNFAAMWQSLDSATVNLRSFDMRYFGPSFLLTEINGYQRPLFKYLHRFTHETYNLHGHYVSNQKIVYIRPTEIELKLDTLNQPKKEVVLVGLSKFFECKVLHFWHDYQHEVSGFGSYKNGKTVNIFS